MRKFFKDSFEAYHGKWLKFKQAVKKMTSSEMFRLSQDFIINKIGKEFNFNEAVNALSTIVLCDWYNKDEAVIKGLDFTSLWMVL